MPPFTPRTTFPTLTSLPRSYFLGHHASGLSKMKSLLGSIDLIIECRDYRVPLTSRNPLFEASLGTRERWIVYTKRDLGGFGGGGEDGEKEEIITKWHYPSKVLFSYHKSKLDIRRILDLFRQHASTQFSITGHRILVVGMPNVGKSSLLNALRLQGVGKGKAAITGAQPGVTRKIGSGVKIIDDDAGDEGGGGVYLLDTPGVFIPYVPSASAMLKLALVGCVKDTVVPAVILADYLLYHLNLHSPSLYAEYHPPTNEIMDLLKAIAHKSGRLQKGGTPDTEAAALWMVQRWRTGHLGRFGLDVVDGEALERRMREEGAGVSGNQARKVDKEMKRERARKRREVG